MPFDLPHFSSREGNAIDAIVLHYPAPNFKHPTAPYSAQAVFDGLMEVKKSYHYYITKQGDIHQFVADDKKAWHAGESTLHGKANCNLFSLGVCMENNGGEQYSDTVIEQTAWLCRRLISRYQIPMNRVVGHVHVSPDRKVDPGPKFPWFKFFMQIAGEKIIPAQP